MFSAQVMEALWSLALYGVIFSLLESLVALHKGQRHLRQDLALDLSYFALNLVTGPALVLVVAAPFLWLSHFTTSLQGFVASLPFWVQFIGVMFFSDLGIYAGHRLLHVVPFLWRFHAIHHSAREMDWATGYRSHPVDMAILKGFMFAPLILLGFSSEVLHWHAIYFGAHSAFLHTNTRLSLGPLRYLYAFPAFHRWHHSDQSEAIDKNFVSHFPWIDALFGTLYLPKESAQTTGTPDPVPQGFIEQLRYPLRSAMNGQATEEKPGAE